MKTRGVLYGIAVALGCVSAVWALPAETNEGVAHNIQHGAASLAESAEVKLGDGSTLQLPISSICYDLEQNIASVKVPSGHTCFTFNKPGCDPTGQAVTSITSGPDSIDVDGKESHWMRCYPTQQAGGILANDLLSDISLASIPPDFKNVPSDISISHGGRLDNTPDSFQGTTNGPAPSCGTWYLQGGVEENALADFRCREVGMPIERYNIRTGCNCFTFPKSIGGCKYFLSTKWIIGEDHGRITNKDVTYYQCGSK